MNNPIRQIWYFINRYWRFAYVKGVVVGVIAFFATSIVSGLIQDTIPQWIVSYTIPWFTQTSLLPNWLVVIIPGGIILVLGFTLRFIHDENHYYKEVLLLITDIDNELRYSVVSRDQNDTDSLGQFIDNLFLRTFGFFGSEVKTGVIFRPEEINPDWLAAWRPSPRHYHTEKRFYIGKESKFIKSRGGAGKAYIENVPVLYNITNPITGESNHPSKVTFKELEEKRMGTNYLSSLIVPIRWNSQVVGVFCIDCLKRDYFTDQDISILQMIADKIGDALFFHQKLGSAK